MVADAVAPSGQPDRGTDVLGAQRAAGVGTITVHGASERAGGSPAVFWATGVADTGRNGNTLDSTGPICAIAAKREIGWPHGHNDHGGGGRRLARSPRHQDA